MPMSKIYTQMGVDYTSSTFHGEFKPPKQKKSLFDGFTLFTILFLSSLFFVMYMASVSRENREINFLDKCVKVGNSSKQCEFELEKNKLNNSYVPIVIPMR